MEEIPVEAPLRIFRSQTSNSASAYIVITGAPADAIRAAAMTGQWLEGRRGFGSAKVTVTIGGTMWSSSVFPHKESSGWFLPIRQAVRKAEGLEEGEPVRAIIAL